MWTLAVCSGLSGEMGCSKTAKLVKELSNLEENPKTPRGKSMVRLNVYHATRSRFVEALNFVSSALGGAYHVAIEVYGQEWAYGATSAGTGISVTEPRKDRGHRFCEAIELGTTCLSPGEVGLVILDLAPAWAGTDYDLLSRNCCHFSKALAKRLGVANLPSWIDRMARGLEAISAPTIWSPPACLASVGSTAPVPCLASVASVAPSGEAKKGLASVGSTAPVPCLASVASVAPSK